ncbi:MAG TPA: condensation domain-containing protein [Pyrinomonadaceae bacterium]|nr:condensation domain-containing protein [Pyrinomonadaceae bacterium]
MSNFRSFMINLSPPDAKLLNAPAIVSNNKQVTYAALKQSILEVERLLDGAEISKGQVVALASFEKINWIAILIAIMRSGRIYMPLIVTADTGAAYLSEVKPHWLIVGESSYPDLAPHLVRHSITRTWRLPNGDSPEAYHLLHLFWGDGPSAEQPNLLSSPDDSYLLPTSGSTGQSKIIVGSFAGLAHFIDWEINALKLLPGTRVSQLTRPTFDPSFRDIYVPLCSGGTLCLPDSYDSTLDPATLLAWLNTSKLSVVHCVPTVFRSLVSQRLTPDLFQDLQYVLIAGEQLYGSDVKHWFDILGTRTQLINLYGPSETTLAKFAYWITPEDCKAERISIGKPISGASAIVLDDNMRVCAPYEVGELYIRTPHRSHGYFNRPDLTQAAFIPNPFSSNETELVYKTGDLGFVRDDGLFELVGRTDDAVKIAGVKIQLSSIEAVIRKLGHVNDVTLKVWRDARNQSFVCAYIVSDQPVEAGGLHKQLFDKLPPYMMPRFFVQVPKLPKNSHGKVDKLQLPPPNEVMDNASAVAPRNSLEAALLTIWKEVLPSRQVIGCHDHFYFLGGQSIEAVQIVGRINRQFGLDLQLREFLQYGTIADLAPEIVFLLISGLDETQWLSVLHRLAAYINQASTLSNNAAVLPLAFSDAPLVSDRKALIRLLSPHGLEPLIQCIPAPDEPRSLHHVHRSNHEPAPLSFAQKRFWNLEKIKPGNPNLNYVWAAELNGPLEILNLGQSLAHMVERHSVTRTVITEKEGIALQSFVVPAEFKMNVHDLSGLPKGLRKSEALGLAQEGARRPFIIGQDLLLRATLYRLEETRHILILSGHVIISDGWSKTLLLREIASLYTASLSTHSPIDTLPPVRVSFADFAHWEHNIAGTVLERHQEYWRAQLGSELVDFKLPYDFPPSGQINSAGDSVMVTLDETLVEEIERIAVACGTTKTAALLAGLVITLAHWSQQDDILLVIPTANRPLAEVETIVGCFTDSFIFRRRVNWHTTFYDFVKEMGQQLIESLENSRMPFELLMENLFPALDKYDPQILPVMFSPQLSVSTDFVLPNVRVEELEIELATSIFNLHVFTFDHGSLIDLKFNFSTDVFQKSSIKRLVGLYKRIIADFTARPDQVLARTASDNDTFSTLPGEEGEISPRFIA